MVRLHKSLLEPLGLTFPQYLVIVELLDGTPRSVGELGGRLGMDTGTITPLVKRMEKAGLVVRTRDTKDERRVLVDLTPTGASLEDAVRRVPEQIISACQLTDERATALQDELLALGRTEYTVLPD